MCFLAAAQKGSYFSRAAAEPGKNPLSQGSQAAGGMVPEVGAFVPQGREWGNKREVFVHACNFKACCLKPKDQVLQAERLFQDATALYLPAPRLHQMGAWYFPDKFPARPAFRVRTRETGHHCLSCPSVFVAITHHLVQAEILA